MMPLSIDDTTWYADVNYLGTPHLIACGVLETTAGLLLVDPGPTVSMGGLTQQLVQRGYTLGDVHAVLLTHIHLDHAGATGSLVDQNERIQVYVHSIGARHMIRPERLLASAQRLYGAQMDSLWGAFLPVPEGNTHALEGGETLEIGGRRFEVAYTPGHAIHHVSYLDEASGTAFVGDTAGMAVTGARFVLPVTPPPDIHLEQWYDSLDVLRGWGAERLFLTHFGPEEEVARHIDEIERKLRAWGEEVRRSLAGDGEDKAQAQAFHEEVLATVEAALPEDLTPPYKAFSQPEASWYGLARYWRKRAPMQAGTQQP